MGFFDKKPEPTTRGQYNVDEYQSNKTLTQIAFETIKKTKFKMQFIVDLVDEETVEDLRDTLEALDNDIENGRMTQATLDNEEIVALLYILGVEVNISGRKLVTREAYKKERVDFLIKCGNIFCDTIWAIKLVAFIEENNQLISEINNSANTEDYTIEELCELANRLSMIKYENFELKSI